MRGLWSYSDSHLIFNDCQGHYLDSPRLTSAPTYSSSPYLYLLPIFLPSVLIILHIHPPCCISLPLPHCREEHCSKNMLLLVILVALKLCSRNWLWSSKPGLLQRT